MHRLSVVDVDSIFRAKSTIVISLACGYEQLEGGKFEGKLMGLISSVPEQLSKLIDGYTVHENHVGHSSCFVFHLVSPSKRGLYLKIQPISTGDIFPEKERLDWLQGKLPVPELVYFDSNEQSQYMLLSEIHGLPSFDLTLQADVPNLIQQLATGLNTIHSLDKALCPFSSSLREKIHLVQELMSKGNVDVEYLSRHYPNPNLQRLFDEMISLLPDTEDLVVCHGDYSMPNVLISDGKISGFIDLGRLSVMDRYVDFVTFRDTLSYNQVPDESFPLFLQQYGLPELDPSKLHFYDLLHRFLG